MSNELVFYTHPMSRGRVVRWMLEELGEPYRTEQLDYGSTMKAPAYLAINPMGKVPALRHGETVVTEGAAICAYLADAFPAAGLAPPPTSPARGDYYRWLFFAAAPMESAMINKALGVAPAADQERMVGWGNYDLALDTLEKAVAGREFLAGDRFSAADLYVSGLIGWGLQTGGIPQRPAFQDFVARLSARPAAVRAREIDDGLLAA
ncbi:glutathione S-transferase family protein [Phenylobacterium aquaticum]|uniref:glutathione S-transferase family protein n=1 Tax=Phenylobacterium aquaticum TaxID=1763816 RepID=UPI0026EF67CB|nr:glutathione S-transferase family protein [Phenylobacterium aquaticum]